MKKPIIKKEFNFYIEESYRFKDIIKNVKRSKSIKSVIRYFGRKNWNKKDRFLSATDDADNNLQLITLFPLNISFLNKDIAGRGFGSLKKWRRYI